MFDVLDRHLNIHQHHVLEASAGTGKTFSIENIIVRLLVESPPVSIQEILVVTFTRASTHDLKVRIRENLEKARLFLHSLLHPSYADLQEAPDYLKAFQEASEEEIRTAKKRLEYALFEYDQAQIFTIHSFCLRTLRTYFFEGDLSLHALAEKETLSHAEIIHIIRNFFRTELKPHIYGQVHFQFLLKHYDHSIEKLENELAKVITQGIPLASSPSFEEQFELFKNAMLLLKKEGFCSHLILKDFYVLAPLYKGMMDRQKRVKPEILSKIQCFATLFDQEDWSLQDYEKIIEDQLFLVKAFDPSALTQKALSTQMPALTLPNLCSLLKQHLEPLVQPLSTFAKLAYDCQKFLKYYQQQEEKFRFDDLLHNMLQALQDQAFAENIRSQYKAALIDEFQDTDPVQWKIFETLFLHEDYTGYLYLVGDPKQSIYAFRQADIYTYLSAAQAIGNEHRVSLATNYRSHPLLVQGLNTLFSQANTPDLIFLPKWQKTLNYQQVQAADKIFDKRLTDEMGAIHFILSAQEKPSLDSLEENVYFPFITQEIHRLCQQSVFKYQDFAVLVADRYQAQRLSDYLKKMNIPSLTQRQSNLADSPAVQYWQELLYGILYARHSSSLKIALGGKIFGWNHEEILKLEDPFFYEKTLSEIYFLRKKLLKEGFIAFYQALMHHPLFQNKQALIEKILQQENGSDFLEELSQIAELLIQKQHETHCPPEGLIAFLDEFPLLKLNDDKRLYKQADMHQQAVQILTLHSSKGLEFEIVFVLGLIKKNQVPSQLIPQFKSSSQPNLELVFDVQDPRYIDYCQELDAEKMRQLYVAFTRAKYRLYVAATSNYERKVAYGCASAMEIFLAKLGRAACSYEELYQRIHARPSQALIPFIKSLSSSISITYTETSALVSSPVQNKIASPILIPPPQIHIASEMTAISSFSQISKQMDQITPEWVESPPHDFEALNKNPHTLPAGNKTGLLLHELLEKFSFEKAHDIHCSADLSAWISPFVQHTEFQAWEQVLAEILMRALKMPLPFKDSCFSLAEVHPSKIFREIEFLYPCEKELLDPNIPKGYLKGIIDLMFEHAGKFYIIDWKSNWLGPNLEAYSPTSLQKAMQTHHYHLQSTIYVESLKRYLQLFNQFNFERDFGGIYYLFLRGLHSENNQFFGCYALPEGNFTC
ncbi:UvrD-helicase domain-containing protein [Parachlamydia sp. AcF125]|uniref:UvrD-helicase domain-containing protein n=1 Tax=Parachlamydia sp. AcF125 TaxID=2795736 RepID=UPI001BC9F20E|nr:UvrD-helicase domain-containing protein [Parachlamydia sp. AcF125]MBS4167839.1 RecBCD enzyme subunit RecB [Parachlamydia sp. AcF125]